MSLNKYIDYVARKKKLYKGYAKGYIDDIEDKLQASDKIYHYTKIIGKPKTIEEYYANNRYLGNKEKVINYIKSNLQEKDIIIRREEFKKANKGGKTYQTNEDAMQAFPTGIQQPFIDWTTKKAKEIYNDLVKKNKLSDFDIAMLEGDKIARETEERARQMQEEANYYNQLPTHNSNGNTINYNSNGHRVASWEDEMAHWELVGEEAERNKMFNENMDSSYMRAEEKSAVEEEAKALKKAQAQQNADNTKAKKRTKHDLLRERVRNKRKADAEAKAIKNETNGVKMPPPPQSASAPPPAPSASVAAPPPAPPIIPSELAEIGWKYKQNINKGGIYDFDFKPDTILKPSTFPPDQTENVNTLPVKGTLSEAQIDAGWTSHLSKTNGYYYYKNTKLNKNTYNFTSVTGGRKRKTKTNKLGKGKGKTRKNTKGKKNTKSKKAQRKTRKSRRK